MTGVLKQTMDERADRLGGVPVDLDAITREGDRRVRRRRSAAACVAGGAGGHRDHDPLRRAPRHRRRPRRPGQGGGGDGPPAVLRRRVGDPPRRPDHGRRAPGEGLRRDREGLRQRRPEGRRLVDRRLRDHPGRRERHRLRPGPGRRRRLGGLGGASRRLRADVRLPQPGDGREHDHQRERRGGRGPPPVGGPRDRRGHGVLPDLPGHLLPAAGRGGTAPPGSRPTTR